MVTGSNGQLGNCLRLASQGSADRFVFTDVEELDICDPAAVRAMVKSEKADVIVNCAAFTNVDAAEDNYELAEKLNSGAVANLASAMKEVGGLLVHISTDYVFGGAAYDKPITEDVGPCPTGVYGETKLHGEEAIMKSGCRYVIIRTAWLYSEFGRNFVKTMLSLFSSKPQVKVVDDQVGTPTYAGDLAAAIMKVLSCGPLDYQLGLYHFSDEGACSWYEFASAIYDLASEKSGFTAELSPCSSSEYPSKVVRPAYSVLDKSLIKKTFGMEIPAWRDSLAVCIKKLQV